MSPDGCVNTIPIVPQEGFCNWYYRPPRKILVLVWNAHHDGSDDDSNDDDSISESEDERVCKRSRDDDEGMMEILQLKPICIFI
ncbi:hypothetical protein F442_20936 [Phytophthora nicotianae P10297]|uniref:Uncharacterized protein n=1 Tax=Phytophthora nicotianae P10297 TaxID=1317064 RepID=W2Y742_PHYNI|nr:hypothetical protein F442_20936 [Phytophthora nicotianae P10297]